MESPPKPESKMPIGEKLFFFMRQRYSNSPNFYKFAFMLRKVRIILAVLFFAGITLLLAGTGRQWWGWMAKLQFLPSCLAGNFIVIGGIALLTLLFGRIYCSVICPLGVYQDLIIWIRRQIGLFANKVNVKRKVKAAQARKEGREVEAVSTLKAEVKHFKYNRERRLPRYIVLGLTALAVFADIQLLVALIEPYSAYGRMVHTAVGMCGGADIPVALMIAAAATLVIISVSAWLWGRAWCSNICPVGSLLGIISRFSLFKIRFDVDKCTACGRCGRGCKASCIDGQAHKVDCSRCVDCFDCIGNCSTGAVGYRFAYGKNASSSAAAVASGNTATLGLEGGPYYGSPVKLCV